VFPQDFAELLHSVHSEVRQLQKWVITEPKTLHEVLLEQVDLLNSFAGHFLGAHAFHVHLLKFLSDTEQEANQLGRQLSNGFDRFGEDGIVNFGFAEHVA
jgi:hypothetical protein